MFTERLHEHRLVIFRNGSKRLRWQLRVLDKAGENSSIMTFRRKVEILVGELDEGSGI